MEQRYGPVGEAGGVVVLSFSCLKQEPEHERAALVGECGVPGRGAGR